MKRRTVICELCGTEISVNCIKNHIGSKTCLDNKSGKSKGKRNIFIPDDLKCSFCEKECKNKNSFINHERLCKLNPEKQQTFFSDNQQKLKEIKIGLGYTNGATKAKKLGMEFVVSEETRKKISEHTKKQMVDFWTPEQRKKHSESMIKAVENNPDSYTKNNVCGRVKNIDYNGATLKGGWELKTAQWLDSQGIIWIHECAAFQYNWDGKDKKYYPDFFLTEHDLYLEVKGYKTDRDVAKWEQFPHKLIIIDKTIIHKLDEISILDLK